jgi:predicted MPP superfamily phosphohydrolase
MVARVNALGADLIAITGDIFDFDPDCVEDGARRLGALRARFGVYAILGNHDHYTGAERVAAALARHAPCIRLLRDEIVRLPVAAPLYLAGVDDPAHHWSARSLELEGLPALAAARPEDGPTLLLAHRPEIFDHAARLGFPIVLAGHTHGGQLALPTPGGRYNLARFATRYTRGIFRRGDSVMYVNRGLGVGGPALRINCPREIACFELVPAGAKPST